MANSLPVSTLVNITLRLIASAAPATAFGIPLIVDTQNVPATGSGQFAVATYTSLSDMTAAGYKPWNYAYKMAAQLLSPLPTGSKIVRKFKVGSFGGAPAVATALDGLQAVDSDWYWLLMSDRSHDVIASVAAWTTNCSGFRCGNRG